MYLNLFKEASKSTFNDDLFDGLKPPLPKPDYSVDGHNNGDSVFTVRKHLSVSQNSLPFSGLTFVFSAAFTDSQSPAGRPAEAAGGEQSHHRDINTVFPRTCSDQVVLLCCSRGWWVMESLRREELHKSGSWDTVLLKMWVKHVDPERFWSVLSQHSRCVPDVFPGTQKDILGPHELFQEEFTRQSAGTDSPVSVP